MEKNRVRLGDICSFQSGGTPSRRNPLFFEGTIPWITTVALSGGYIGYNDAIEWISDEAIANSAAKIVPQNSLLVGTRVGVGKVAINTIPMSTSQDIISLLNIDESKWSKEFLCRLIQGKATCLQSQARGATIKGIKIESISNITIPVISLCEQIKIATLLNSVGQIINARKQQLAALDTLIKARFVEMFGANSQYESVPLANNVEEMFIGPFGSSLKNECFVPKQDAYCMVYEQKHAIQKTMNVETRYVNEAKFKELKRFSVHGGDIIVSCRGTIGEVFIVPDEAPLGIMHPSIMKIRLKSSSYNTVFFSNLLNRYMQIHEDEAKGSGVKMAVTATILGQEYFCKPPISVQNKFAAFVAQVDKSKATVQKSLDESQVLFDSLMQEYFV